MILTSIIPLVFEYDDGMPVRTPVLNHILNTG